MTTWPADNPEEERRLARTEQRVGWIAMSLTTACLIALIWTWALTNWPMFDSWVVPSLLPTYSGLISLMAAVGLWLVLRRFAGLRRATIIVGLIVVLGAIALGMSPLTAGRSRGWCKSVIGNVGLHGDDREDCFDARASRADDVAIVLTFGLLITAAGCAPLVKRKTNRPHWRTRTFPGLSDQPHHGHVLADASETI